MFNFGGSGAGEHCCCDDEESAGDCGGGMGISGGGRCGILIAPLVLLLGPAPLNGLEGFDANNVGGGGTALIDGLCVRCLGGSVGGVM